MRWLIGLVARGVALSGCSTSDSFTVGEDDLCEWLTEEQVAAAAAAGYATLGVDWDGEPEVIHEGAVVPAPGGRRHRCAPGR